MTYVLGQTKGITNGLPPFGELDLRIDFPVLPSFTKPPPIRPPPDNGLYDGIEEVTDEDRIETDLEDQYTNGEMPEDEHEPFVPPEDGYPDVGEQPVDEGMEYPNVGDEYVAADEEQPAAGPEVPVVAAEEKKFPWLLVAGAGVGAIALFYFLKKKK